MTGLVTGTVDGEHQAGGGKRDAGLLADAAGRGEFRYLAEWTPTAARITVEIAGARGLGSLDGFDSTRRSSGARRASAAPGVLHGQEGFLSG